MTRVVLGLALAVVALAVLPAPAQAGCTAELYCNDACSTSITCPGNGCQLSCSNGGSYARCSGTSSCSVGQNWVICDGVGTNCAPFICMQDTTWVLCNHNSLQTCPEPWESCS